MLKFFDFCSGIGGGRIGLENNGLECVGHSEIDKKAETTYKLFFNDERNFGDLTELNASDFPYFDFMIAGFPCQTFSVLGKRKGFADKRGLIIYSLVRILKEKNIKYFILENVKGLLNHDSGKTFDAIKAELEQVGYNIYYKVLNSIEYGVPQSRERIYIVGFKHELDTGFFQFPKGKRNDYNFVDFIDKDNYSDFDIQNETFQKFLSNKYNKGKYNNNEILTWENYIIDCRQSDLRKYKAYFPTLRNGRHGLLYVKNETIKELNAYESLLLQGFPKSLAQKVKEYNLNNNTILSQAGNAMTVTVIEKIASEMLKVI